MISTRALRLTESLALDDVGERFGGVSHGHTMRLDRREDPETRFLHV